MSRNEGNILMMISVSSIADHKSRFKYASRFGPPRSCKKFVWNRFDWWPVRASAASPIGREWALANSETAGPLGKLVSDKTLATGIRGIFSLAAEEKQNAQIGTYKFVLYPKDTKWGLSQWDNGRLLKPKWIDNFSSTTIILCVIHSRILWRCPSGTSDVVGFIGIR